MERGAVVGRVVVWEGKNFKVKISKTLKNKIKIQMKTKPTVCSYTFSNHMAVLWDIIITDCLWVGTADHELRADKK